MSWPPKGSFGSRTASPLRTASAAGAPGRVAQRGAPSQQGVLAAGVILLREPPEEGEMEVGALQESDEQEEGEMEMDEMEQEESAVREYKDGVGVGVGFGSGDGED